MRVVIQGIPHGHVHFVDGQRRGNRRDAGMLTLFGRKCLLGVRIAENGMNNRGALGRHEEIITECPYDATSGCNKNV